MGHDIYGIKTEDTTGEFPSLKKHVAYLRRSCFSEERIVIYKALNADKHYASASGLGTWQMFNKNKLKNALETLDDRFIDQKKFIQDCLNNLDKKDEIAIVFG